MTKHLFIDIETFSSVSLKESGVYKYVESPDFTILLFSYAIVTEENILDRNPAIITVDLTKERLPEEVEELLFDSTVIKHAHNASFERICLRRAGYDVPAEEWRCTSVKSGYCGYPLALKDAAIQLKVENLKLDTGKALIKLFSCPIKPTAINNYKTRATPSMYPMKWADYKMYNAQDVSVEKDIFNTLYKYEWPEFEKELYALDAAINDNGVFMDIQLIKNAISIDKIATDNLIHDVVSLTGIINPNSDTQIKKWLTRKLGVEITSLTAETVPVLIEKYKHLPEINYVLNARQMLNQTSTAKYLAMLNCRNKDGRARGLFQFYGATRTGRWAGRLIQLHNLPRNTMADLDLARDLVLRNDADTISMIFGSVPKVLSQLIRTAFIPQEGNILLVADYSAIEARITAWLANEEWRLDIFKTHGKIYEASAAFMFGVPIESVTKGSDLRQKGKVAELALGYEGSIGAMKNMGAEDMGLSDAEIMSIVRRWRDASPNIVAMWAELNKAAIKAVRFNTTVETAYRGITFDCNGEVMTILLPSGRKLFYAQPRITTNKFGQASVEYKGLIQTKNVWGTMDTYGGKLTENIVQAIARDVLGYAMVKLNKYNFKIVMHIHDEVICEQPIDDYKDDLRTMNAILGEEIPWAAGLPLRAEGFSTQFYKKD